MRLKYLLICVSFCFAAKAQTFEVDTVMKNGPVSNRINLVFLGDGYTETEQAKFITDVDGILDEMFSQAPFVQYKNYFNAFAIRVISAESGANHPQNSNDGDGACPAQSVKSVNNYFGSTFDYQGIHRLLYPPNISKIVNVLAANFPLYDQAFIVVNSPYYGGAGGFVATCSGHSAGRDVAIHEIGHSFAGLADEYWAGAGYASEKPNMTKETSPALVKWKNWMGTNGVGIYPHSVDASWKKPHTNCKMGILNAALCSVCAETFIERFHQLVTPVAGFSPVDRRFNIDPELEQPLEFSLSLVPPDPNTLKITWEIGNVLKSKNTEALTVLPGELAETATIRATVRDTIALTRSDTHTASHTYVVEWDITKSNVVTGVHGEVKGRQYSLSIYPNPSDADITISYTLPRAEVVTINLMDNSGRLVSTLVDGQQREGTYHHSFTRQRIANGEYILHVNFGKTLIPVKMILK